MVIHLNAATDLEREFLRMSDSQVKSLVLAYNQGGYILSAIAWQESQAGKYRIGVNEGSVDLGLFHLTSSSFLARWYREHPDKVRTKFYDNIILSRVIIDDTYSSTYAYKELQYWNVKRKRTMRDSVKSYNCGNNIKRKRCDLYLSRIWEKRTVLIRHLRVGRYERKEAP